MQFENTGHDEDGNAVGNCKLCNGKGVLIYKHNCTAPKITITTSPLAIKKVNYTSTIELGKVSSEINKEIMKWHDVSEHNNGYAQHWYVEKQSTAAYPFINQYLLDQGIKEGETVIVHSYW